MSRSIRNARRGLTVLALGAVVALGLNVAHAKNIAKYVVFIVRGKDVRHVRTRVLDQEI